MSVVRLIQFKPKSDQNWYKKISLLWSLQQKWWATPEKVGMWQSLTCSLTAPPYSFREYVLGMFISVRYLATALREMSWPLLFSSSAIR